MRSFYRRVTGYAPWVVVMAAAAAAGLAAGAAVTFLRGNAVIVAFEICVLAVGLLVLPRMRAGAAAVYARLRTGPSKSEPNVPGSLRRLERIVRLSQTSWIDTERLLLPELRELIDKRRQLGDRFVGSASPRLGAAAPFDRHLFDEADLQVANRWVAAGVRLSDLEDTLDRIEAMEPAPPARNQQTT